MSEQTHGEPQIPWEGDEPILRATDDRLARSDLAKAMARQILAYDKAKPLIVGLHAPWGAGKSSFLGLLEEALQKNPQTPENKDNQAPVILRFNPWHYESTEDLLTTYIQLLRALLQPKRSWLDRYWRKWKLKRALEIPLQLLGFPYKQLGELALAISESLTDTSLADLKRSINESLAKRPDRIVVFIDDVDRLERDHLRMLFRMIRLIADFHNVTYVVAFDPKIVAKHINDDAKQGRAYLKKIIQVNFDLPSPEPSTLDRLLWEQLDPILAAVNHPLTDSHLLDVKPLLVEHFKTLRDIKRYCNALRFTLLPIAAEVNAVDFLVLEFLRIAYPNTYQKIPLNRANLAISSSSRKVAASEHKKARDKLSITTPNLAPLIKKLFPAFENSGSNIAELSVGASVAARWLHERRVCHPDNFDRYFLLRNPHGDISEKVVTAFVDCLERKDIDGAKESVNQARSMDAEGSFWRRVESRISASRPATPEFCDSIIRLVFEIGDTCPNAPEHLVEKTLESISVDQRTQTIRSHLEQAKALVTITRTIYRLSRDAAQSGAPHTGWADLTSSWRERLIKEANRPTFWTDPNVLNLLDAWGQLDRESKDAVVKNHVVNDENAVALLELYAPSIFMCPVLLRDRMNNIIASNPSLAGRAQAALKAYPPD